MIPTIDKPCIRQCCLNEKDVCMGCFRTFSDMQAWHKVSVEEKTKILDEAKKRKEVHHLGLKN
ncbi:MAG: DUF1289 domain-containing protein [Sulfurovum sp.]|nr:DUF1289 domain-containing protein [Sulfurovum sp.]